MKKDHLVSYSENETINLGKKFASYLKIGDVVAFYGNLGAGKTEFIKGICQHFLVKELVTSPTFTVINQYEGEIHGKDVDIYHIDLYRIKKTEELIEIGFEECIYNSDSIKLIEWAEKAEIKLSKIDYKVSLILNEENENQREIIIEHFN